MTASVPLPLEADLEPLLVHALAPLHEQTPRIFGLPPLPQGYVIRPDALDAVRKALLGSRPMSGIVAAAALHGIGGLGKTVLARAICDDPTIRAAFPDGILWATVGQSPDLNRLQREWVRALYGDLIAVTSPEGGRAEIQRLVAPHRMLLILDDIWHEQDIHALEVEGPGVRVLITTRDAGQARDAVLISLELMQQAECRAILQHTTHGRALDDATLNAIAHRTGYLPLALKIVGGLLAQGFTWAEIQTEMDAGHLRHVALPGQRGIFDAIDASVRFLPAEQQQRYNELVIFPQDEPLSENAVIRLWGKTGDLDAFVAKQLLYELRERSLIQADNTLHDLQYDYLHAVVALTDQRMLHEQFAATYGPIATWVHLPDDDAGYHWRHLATHLSLAGKSVELRQLLTDGSYLQEKMRRLGVGALQGDMELLTGDTTLTRLAAAIRAGAIVLSQVPEELWNQSQGRAKLGAALHATLPRILPRLDLQFASLRHIDALQQVTEGHTAKVWWCALNANGSLALSASEDQTLRLWDVASGKCIRVFTGHRDRVNWCAFSPDEQHRLSASGDGTIRLWHVASGVTLRVFSGHTDAVWACALSADGQHLLSSSYDRTLRLWEVASGVTLRILTGHESPLVGCALSFDEQFALSAGYQTLHLWDVASGATIQIFTGHESYVNWCIFSPDGQQAISASGDHTLRVWDVTSGETTQVLHGHTSSVRSCVFHPNGKQALSASWDTTMRLWDVTSGDTIQIFTGHATKVWGCALSQDGKQALSAADDSSLRLWEVASGATTRIFQGSRERINACVFSPNGQQALSASDDGMLRVWNTENGSSTHLLHGHQDAINGCAFSPDGHSALSASNDRTLRLWDTQRGTSEQIFTGHAGGVHDGVFSPDGKHILSASVDTTLRLWNITTGETVRVFAGHHDKVNGCAISPNGLRALSASNDQTMRLWDLASGTLLHTFVGHRERVNTCQFSPDGRLALSASWDNSLWVWDIASGAVVLTLEGHLWPVNGGAFSPAGDAIVSASDDRTLRLWDLASGHERCRWTTDAELRCCAFSPDGHQIITGDSMRGVHFLALVTAPPNNS